MPAQAEATDLVFRIELERRIDASIEDVFEALLAQLGPDAVTPDGTSLAMKIEPFPGGRWYRDLGNQNGHHWAHVQAIKRPSLMELTGPLFMSNGACNNVQYRLEESDGVTTLKMVHQGLGVVDEETRAAIGDGWADQLRLIDEKVS